MAVLTALWLQHCRQLIVCRASQAGIVLAAGAWDLDPDSSGGSGGEDGHVADRDHRTAPNRTLTWCQELTSSAQGRSPVRALWPGPQLATDNGSPEASLVVEYDDGTLVVFTVRSGGEVREISKVELAMAETTILNIAHVLLCDHETLVLTAQVGRDQSSSYSVFIVDLATGQAQPCDGQEDLLAEADCGTCSSFACYARCLRSGQVSVLTTKDTSPSQAETLLWKSQFSLLADCARYALLGCACTCIEKQSNSTARYILCLVSDSGRAQVAMSDSPGIALREEIAAGFTGMLESACPEIALLHCDKSLTFSSDANLQATTSLRFDVLRGPNEEAYECSFTWDPASGLTRQPRIFPHQQGGLASTAQRMVLESLNAQVTQAKEAFASRRAFLQQKEKLVASLELDIEGTCTSDRTKESRFSPETDLEPLFDDRACPTSTLNAVSRDCEIAGDAAISPEQVHVSRVACCRHMLRVDAIVQGTKDVCIFALVDGASVVHAQCYRGSWAGSPDAQHFLVSIIMETDQIVPMQGCQIELYCWDPSSPRHVFRSRTLGAPFQELNPRLWREEMEDLALFSDYWKVGVSVAEDADAGASTLADVLEMHYDGKINSKDCSTVRWKKYQDRGLEIAASHAIDFVQAMEKLRTGLNRHTKLFIVPGQTKSAWLQAIRTFCEAAQQEIQTLSNNVRTSPALAISLQLQTDRAAGYLANGLTLFGLHEQG